MIKLAFTKDALITADFIRAYHKKPLFFNNIHAMFKFIKDETGLDSTMIKISYSGGEDERFKCDKDPDGFLTWRELLTYDINTHSDVTIGYVDLGDRTRDDIGNTI